ncbi:MAG: hypothetical protein B0D96_03725 [Candidatus Sedimenticola endophacoides]|uniref:LysR family transcriptional regulator n=1 Tax=Candidatus Sedimenticola endophacoides TaxID=2548426 RepID=A0A657PXT0_9GAMM|nr:MAG: hypothetical protein B0D94_01720 [Candidatus Sedimenticola endophacoides]OQX36625.1 MAG: hypothetical protein B0D96_03725 [Candidatus Sedimenticola endophacoides]OQX41580.1 MAG: hypothetical protein B0D89_03665 [Candidatus Sedimenticola endophacoides]OQX46683.1 MAG: hypothetical protein B0D85_03275 [Candidatus Sedimenticola endophacoides]OQX48313.1 MAG: hypothetical protein B0D87_06335 [Candidatus Sedimenticola endophacoides]
MDITFLKTFLEVAKTRHFGRSADALFITQSAVSARIKLLEQTLGVELFVRKRNDIQLTPSGANLLRHAEGIVKGWERARQAIAVDPALAASLSVGCLFDLWSILVRKWSARVSALAPDIALQADILNAEVMVQRLSLGVLDLGFMFDPPQTPDLELRQVTAVPLILVSSRQGQDLDGATTEGYVMVDWGSAFGVVHAEKFPNLPAPHLRTNSGQVALDYIHGNGGAAYLPLAVVAPLLDNGLLHRVDDAPVIERHAYAVFRADAIERYSLKKALAALE